MILKEHLIPLVNKRFHSDSSYRERHLKIINAQPYREILGVQTPALKQIAKSFSKDSEQGMDMLLRFETTETSILCYEETVVWGYLINDLNFSITERFIHLGKFIPNIDNWAVCDAYCAHAKWMSKTEKQELWEFLSKWFRSVKEFEVRFAIVSTMTYLMTKEWLPVIFKEFERIDFEKIQSRYQHSSKQYSSPRRATVAGKSPYYVRMAVAWFLATSLVKYPNETRHYVKESQLPTDVIRLYVRKARESYRSRNINPL